MVTHSISYQAVLTNPTPYIKSLLEDEGIFIYTIKIIINTFF